MRPFFLRALPHSAEFRVPSVLYFIIGLFIVSAVGAHVGALQPKLGYIQSSTTQVIIDAGVGSYAQMEAEDDFDEDAAYAEAFAQEFEDDGLGDLEIITMDDNAPIGTAQADTITDTSSPGLTNYVERAEEDLLIVEVVVDADSVLDPGVIVYVDDEGTISLPLSVLTELMQFPITVNPGSGVAEGWFIEEANSFILKPPYQTMIYKGETIEISPRDIENQADDIFITEAFFERVFPVDLNLNYNELRLYLEAEEDLPFQVLAKRRAKWQQANRQSNQPGRYLEGEVIRLPYKKYSYPTIQVNHSLNASSTAGVSQNGSTSNVQTQGDFLGMNLRSNGSFTTNSAGVNEFNNFSFTFQKEDYEAKLLGLLKATSFELGDVSSSSLSLATGFQRGRGASVTNAPLNFVRNPNDFVIEDFGPIGYDVEVYQNARLLAFDTIDDDGRYQFDTLPLRQGFNLFRIVLYGPNGEKEERFERFYLGQNMVDEGQFIYDATVLESSTPVFDPSRNPADETSGTLSLQGDYGLTEKISLNAGVFQGPNGNGVLRGIGGGVRASSNSVFSQFNVFQADNGARSFNAEATGNITKDLYWNLGQTVHNGYDPGERTVERDTFGSLSKQFSLNLIPQGSISFGFRDQRLDSGVNTRTYTNKLSGQAFQFNFSNDIDYDISDNADPVATGSFTARRRVPFGNLRARLNYGLKNPAEFQSADLQLQTRLNERLAINTLLNSSFTGIRETSLQAGLDMKFDKFRLGMTASGSTEDNYSAGLTLAYNFVPQSINGDYKLTGDTSDLNTGILLVRPFVDENQNDSYDDGETIVEGLQFRNLLTGKRAKSGEDGVATLPGLSPAVVNRITVNEESYPDIYLVADKQELNVYGKRGIGGPIDYPLNKLGEISGYIYVGDPSNGELNPLPNVVMYLLNDKGDVYQEAYSEFDGFYSFTSIPVGTYKVYFPRSTALGSVYSGEATSKPFDITYGNIEIIDGDFEVVPGQILPLGESIDMIGVSNAGPRVTIDPVDSVLKVAQSEYQPRAPRKNGFFTMILAPMDKAL